MPFIKALLLLLFYFNSIQIYLGPIFSFNFGLDGSIFMSFELSWGRQFDKGTKATHGRGQASCEIMIIAVEELLCCLKWRLECLQSWNFILFFLCDEFCFWINPHVHGLTFHCGKMSALFACKSQSPIHAQDKQTFHFSHFGLILKLEPTLSKLLNFNPYIFIFKIIILLFFDLLNSNLSH